MWPRLTCVVHIGDFGLFLKLQENAMATGTEGPLRVEYFNVHDSGARAFLDRFPIAAAEPHFLRGRR